MPFIFVTGHGRDGIDGRYAGTPILPKPFRRHALPDPLIDKLVRPLARGAQSSS